MITSAKNYTKRTKTKPKQTKQQQQKKTDRQNPRQNLGTNPKSTVAQKVHRLSFGMIRCLFRYSRGAAYIKLIVEI